MVKATVCCTKCAAKWVETFPDNNWGDMLYIICKSGHKSYEVLDSGTKVDSNNIHVDEMFDSNDHDEEDLVGV